MSLDHFIRPKNPISSLFFGTRNIKKIKYGQQDLLFLGDFWRFFKGFFIDERKLIFSNVISYTP